MHEDEGAHFITGLGLTVQEGDERYEGRVRVPVGGMVPGTGYPLPSVLFTYADVVAGSQASRRTFPRVSVTVDLNVEMLAWPATESVTLVSHILRSGTRVTVSEIGYFAPGSREPFATSVGTFMASPREADALPADMPQRRGAPWEMTVPLSDHVGLKTPEPGTTVLYRRADLGNASDSLQGGLTGLLAEVAAESLVSAERDAPQVARRLDVRFLAAVRIGPGVATARLVRSDRRGDTVRVEVRDAGQDDRLTALVHVECVALDATA